MEATAAQTLLASPVAVVLRSHRLHQRRVPSSRAPVPPARLRSSFSGTPLGPTTAAAGPRRDAAASAGAGRGPPVITAAFTVSEGLSSFTDFFKRIFSLPSSPKDPESEAAGMGDGEAQAPRLRVAVVGATGRVGRHVVKGLADAGHQVVALVASPARAEEVLVGEQGLALGSRETGGQVEVVEGELEDVAAVRSLLRGTDAVVCCVGGRYRQPAPAGENAAANGAAANSPATPALNTRRLVDGEGIIRLVQAAVEEYNGSPELFAQEAAAAAPGEGEGGVGGDALEGEQQGSRERVLYDFTGLGSSAGGANGVVAVAPALGGDEEAVEYPRVDGWNRMDDVIMGGQSESTLRPAKGFAVFEGIVRVEGGGFCAARAVFPDAPLDASGYDGLQLRVRGDGQRYKINLRDTEVRSEFQYQASFDTLRGQWVDVFIPFDTFRGVERSKGRPDAPPLNKTQLRTLGLVLSRFQYDGFPNPLFRPGPFRLEIESIKLYRKARPQFVLLSSAAVERSARAETDAERAASIPIVQLNPFGVLSWKLSSEAALRASGLRYTIVRPCGITEEDQDETFLLESAQGDVITGLISPAEAAAVCLEALETPDSINTTFEVRRDYMSKGLQMQPRNWRALFSRLRPDVPAAAVLYPAVPKEMSESFKG